MSSEKVSEIIMAARAHWFEDEETEKEGEAGDDEKAADTEEKLENSAET